MAGACISGVSLSVCRIAPSKGSSSLVRATPGLSRLAARSPSRKWRTVLRAIFRRRAIARIPSPSAYVRRSTSARRWASGSCLALMADGGGGGDASDFEADLRVVCGYVPHHVVPEFGPAGVRVGPGHRQHNVDRATVPERQHG